MKKQEFGLRSESVETVSQSATSSMVMNELDQFEKCSDRYILTSEHNSAFKKLCQNDSPDNLPYTQSTMNAKAATQIATSNMSEKKGNSERIGKNKSNPVVKPFIIEQQLMTSEMQNQIRDLQEQIKNFEKKLNINELLPAYNDQQQFKQKKEQTQDSRNQNQAAKNSRSSQLIHRQYSMFNQKVETVNQSTELQNSKDNDFPQTVNLLIQKNIKPSRSLNRSCKPKSQQFKLSDATQPSQANGRHSQMSMQNQKSSLNEQLLQQTKAKLQKYQNQYKEQKQEIQNLKKVLREKDRTITQFKENLTQFKQIKDELASCNQIRETQSLLIAELKSQLQHNRNNSRKKVSKNK